VGQAKEFRRGDSRALKRKKKHRHRRNPGEKTFLSEKLGLFAGEVGGGVQDEGKVQLSCGGEFFKREGRNDERGLWGATVEK